MRFRLPSSVLVLSVDWPATAKRHPHQQLFPADKLIRLLQRYQLSSTWSLHEPHASPVPDQLSQAGVPHEVALFTHGVWSDPVSERRVFGAELQRRLGAALDRGITIRTLAVAPGRVLPHLDLVHKSAISSVREEDRRPARENSGLPHTLRYGLWNVPASRTLPEPFSWVWNPTGSTRRLVQSIANGQVGHVVIQGDQIADRKLVDFRALEQLLRNVAEVQQAGRLYVDTVSQFVARLNAPARATASCSILRKVA